MNGHREHANFALLRDPLFLGPGMRIRIGIRILHAFSPTAFRLGVPISLPRLLLTVWDGFGRVHGGSMNYIGRTSSLHFLTGTELHRNGEVHGGSMKKS